MGIMSELLSGERERERLEKRDSSNKDKEINQRKQKIHYAAYKR